MKFELTKEGFLKAKEWLYEIGEWGRISNQPFSNDGFTIISAANDLWEKLYVEKFEWKEVQVTMNGKPAKFKTYIFDMNIISEKELQQTYPNVYRYIKQFPDYSIEFKRNFIKVCFNPAISKKLYFKGMDMLDEFMGKAFAGLKPGEILI